MANQLNEFDRLIKETYESQDFPYDSSVWDGIEKELGTTAPASLDFFKSVTTGLAIAGAVFATMLIFTTDTASFMEQPENQETILSESLSENGSDSSTYETDKELFSKDTEENNASAEDKIAERDFESKTTSTSTVVAAENKKLTDEQNPTIVAFLAEAKNISSENFDETDSSIEGSAGNEENSSTSVKVGCTGLTIDFSAPEEYGSDAKYLWNFGDGYFSNEENPTHAFNKEGIFDVSLSVTAVGSGQISSNVVQAMIEVHEAPEARYDLEIGSMTEIVLRDISVNSINHTWLIDEEQSTPEGTDLLLSIADNTKFDIELAVENAGECADTLAKEIHIIKAGNQFPQLYSSAYASDFAPGAIVDNGEVTDFRVFEKSTQEEVFKSTGSKGWNGKNKKGEEVDKGAYEWMMIVDSKDLFNVYYGTLSVR